MELFGNGAVIDVYGDINVDGSSQAWDYEDGWGYRRSGTSASTVFNPFDWDFSGKNALDNSKLVSRHGQKNIYLKHYFSFQ